LAKVTARVLDAKSQWVTCAEAAATVDLSWAVCKERGGMLDPDSLVGGVGYESEIVDMAIFRLCSDPEPESGYPCE
jgi:hypothetical protein